MVEDALTGNLYVVWFSASTMFSNSQIMTLPLLACVGDDETLSRECFVVGTK